MKADIVPDFYPDLEAAVHQAAEVLVEALSREDGLVITHKFVETRLGDLRIPISGVQRAAQTGKNFFGGGAEMWVIPKRQHLDGNG